jgi:pimeloyl-ACP methyl ester carboxylesterase
MFHTKRYFGIFTPVLLFVGLSMIINAETVYPGWEPPSIVSREECVKASQAVLAIPNIKVAQKEDVFRIRVVEMDWDIGVMVYQPEDPSKIPVGPEGRKVGVFLLHGGSGDYRAMERLALLLVSKYGYKVASMTFPGRLYLQDPSRKWPGDTLNPDGTVRTPIWKKDELITPDQYQLIVESSDLTLRKKYGSRHLARAKPGTTFYNRLAGWPIAFEEGMKEVCRRHLPEGEYSIYAHGHSTGGPFAHMLLQRVPNVAGLIGIENTPFGYIYAQMKLKTVSDDFDWTDPFSDLYIRTWRDIARYSGPEALAIEGPNALKRLPMLIEEVFEDWDKGKTQPQLKAEWIIHFGIKKQLEAAARATAKRLNMNPGETENLVKRYTGYIRELSGPGVKPVPPLLLGLAKDSVDHPLKVYQEVVLPMFAAMNPPPKVRVIQFDAGVHGYTKPEKDLPQGIAPAVTKLWHDAIMKGYYVK